MEFLELSEVRPRALTLSIQGLSPKGMFLGQGSQGLEVVIFNFNCFDYFINFL